MDLARCVLGPDCVLLHDPEALAGVASLYDTRAKPVALRDTMGLASTDPAFVQAVRQYFGERAATTIIMLLRVRRDMGTLLIIMVIGRFLILEVARQATGVDADDSTYRLLQYVYTVFVVALATGAWHQAWVRKAALHALAWGMRKPSEEALAAQQAAAGAAAAASVGSASRLHARTTAGAKMAGGCDEAPEEDCLVLAGRYFKPWYTRRDIAMHWLQLACIFILQLAAFTAIGYFAWWAEGARLPGDNPPGILVPVILASLSGVTLAAGEAAFTAIRACCPRGGITAVGTGVMVVAGGRARLPAGHGVDACRRLYTRVDEAHDVARAVLVRALPHFVTVLYLGLVDEPATGGRLSYDGDPFQAAAYQLLGLNIMQFLVDFVGRALAAGLCRRARPTCRGRITALVAPFVRHASGLRLPWYLFFTRWPTRALPATTDIAPSASVAGGVSGEKAAAKGEPYVGADGRGPWGTPPLSSPVEGAVRRRNAYVGMVTGALEPSLSKRRAVATVDGGVVVTSAAAPAAATNATACGVLGASKEGFLELAAEKLVEARAAVGLAVQSRAALLQVYQHWRCLRRPEAPPPPPPPQPVVAAGGAGGKATAGGAAAAAGGGGGGGKARVTGGLRGGGREGAAALLSGGPSLKMDATATAAGVSTGADAGGSSSWSRPLTSDDDDPVVDYSYLKPLRELPDPGAASVLSKVGGEAGAREAAALVDVNAYAPVVFSGAVSVPGTLPPTWDADHYAQMAFVLCNAVMLVILQPWYVLFATPLVVYALDNYVDTLVNRSRRTYPSRLLTSPWGGIMRGVTYTAALVAVVFMARNPPAAMSAITWELTDFKPAEFTLAVVGVTLLWLIVQAGLEAVLAGNWVCNACCCGRRLRDYAAISAYLAYVERELFEKASRMQVEYLARAGAVANLLPAMDHAEVASAADRIFANLDTAITPPSAPPTHVAAPPAATSAAASPVAGPVAVSVAAGSAGGTGVTLAAPSKKRGVAAARPSRPPPPAAS